jgi:hypothetical protein
LFFFFSFCFLAFSNDPFFQIPCKAALVAVVDDDDDDGNDIVAFRLEDSKEKKLTTRAARTGVAVTRKKQKAIR